MSEPPVTEASPPPSAQELKQRAQQLLEFDQVLSLLAARTTFELAREQALHLQPAWAPDQVVTLQRETAAAALFLSRAPDIDCSGARDIRLLLKRAGLSGMLTGSELRDVLLTLRAARSARRALLRRKRDIPELAALAEGIPELTELEQELGARIGSQGEVLDNATPELARLRAETHEAHQRLVQALNRIIRSSLGREVLQEPVITLRSERLVLPVKIEFKRRLPGLVHDVSASGVTVFVEPYETVELGNTYRELALAEQREVNRVYQQLSALVGEHSTQALQAVTNLASLDLILAKVRLGPALRAILPAPGEGPGSQVRLVNARHPLLSVSGVRKADKGQAVPISLEITAERNALLITGPNAGGKTVALKTVGLLALMAQAGLLIPAETGSILSTFDAIYADIGDQQSIEQSRSSFGAHVSNIAAILRAATPHSLVLLDELGTGTDPEEGAALAKAVLSHLSEAGTAVVATGHYRSVANFVEQQHRMRNASVELDPVTLAPTYRLTMGLPGRSYALIIASGLGLSPTVVQQARGLLEAGSQVAEELLTEVQRERHAAVEKRREAEEALSQAQARRRELEAQLAEMAAQKGELLEQARRELLVRAEEVRSRLREAEQVAAAERNQAALREALSRVLSARKELRGAEWRPAPAEAPAWWQSLRPGDRVQVRGLNLQGTVLTPPDARGRVEVAIGTGRAQMDIEQLSPVTGGIYPRPAPTVLKPAPRSGVNLELNLRGQRVEEALARLETFIDQAIRQGLSQVRILHGRGTGALRQALREHLGQHPQVKSWSPGEPPHQEAVTVVELR